MFAHYTHTLSTHLQRAATLLAVHTTCSSNTLTHTPNHRHTNHHCNEQPPTTTQLTYKFEGGYAYLYRNDTAGDQAIYLEEKVKFGLTNMHIIDHESSDVYTVKLMPGKTDFIVIKQTRLDLAYNFKYESSIKSAPVKRVAQK
jgi:hypothetical protein